MCIRDRDKGFGFITVEDRKEVFVHYFQIQKDGFKSLEENEEVTYEAVSYTHLGVYKRQRLYNNMGSYIQYFIEKYIWSIKFYK